MWCVCRDEERGGRDSVYTYSDKERGEWRYCKTKRGKREMVCSYIGRKREREGGAVYLYIRRKRGRR